MTPFELRQALEELFGKTGAVGKASIALRCDEHSLQSWLDGQQEIPGPVISALELARACPPERLPSAWGHVWPVDGQSEQKGGESAEKTSRQKSAWQIFVSPQRLGSGK